MCEVSRAMPLPWEAIQQNAVTFARRWKDGWDEKSEAQSFVRDFMRVFGVDDAAAVGRFEERALREAGRGFMDYFWAKKIAIEMKSKGRDLERAYTQLADYLSHLPEDEVPDLWMVCDFETIIIWRRSTKQRKQFKTKDLKKNIKQFADIAGYETQITREDQLEINVKAAEKMALLHDALKGYGYEGHDLEVYLVRLLFCLFADDTGIFPQDTLYEYFEQSKSDGSDLSDRISHLFEVLNMPDEVRAKRTLLGEALKQFRYINGGLFEKTLPAPEFDAKMRKTLLDCVNFNWSKISPAIFGAMFQGVMDKQQRRELGAHYTSEENILKLINPLFMDELWAEFERVKYDPKLLEAFHKKIARLKFLDPACGCGNFLIVTYGKLRELEFEILKMKLSESAYAQVRFGENPLEGEILVNVNQFYGIEYEDFPCQIAQVGMWLMDHQMNNRVADHFGIPFVRLPLRASATIVNGNALRLDWTEIVPKHELSYILGNPPFVGASMMSAEQKNDAVAIFGKIKLSNSIDYVGAWYHKAAAYILGTAIRVAFVSTNSITQGEQVAPLWGKMFDTYGVHIDFSYRTFKWSNEGKGKAAVHCVIIGFSSFRNAAPRIIYQEDDTTVIAQNINPYLIDAPDVLIASRSKPICDVPQMYLGNKPADGGHLILTAEERVAIISKEPDAARVIKPYVGATEFINGGERYCIWLQNVPYSAIKNCPLILHRIEQVRAFRLNSSARPTVEKADTPHLFFFISQPKNDYLLIPSTSSENRRYIPIGYLCAEVITSNANMILPNATLFHFGILTSNVHNAWMRVVCGRLKSDYRYTGAIVYNNFPWPRPTDAQKAVIEAAAQGVLDTRAMYPNSTLADMYGEDSMPFHPALVSAHKKLDKAVWAAYGFTPRTHPSEASVVASLMEMWRGY